MSALQFVALGLVLLLGAGAMLCLAAVACNPNNLDPDEL